VKRPSTIQSTRGFSLIEVLAAMAILLLIVLMISQVFTGTSQAFSQGMITTEQGSSGRSALNFMASEMQGAMSDDRVPIEIVYTEQDAALSGEITFITQNVFMNKPGDAPDPPKRRSGQIVKYGLYKYPGSPTDPERWQLWRGFEDGKDEVSKVYVDSAFPSITFGSAGTSNSGMLLDNISGFKVVAITASGRRLEEGLFGGQLIQSSAEDPAVALEIYLEVLGEEYAGLVGTKNREKAELLSSRYFTRVNLLNAVGHQYDQKEE
jgi:prepilin-type N-terminal cleavage/methylation domain-containing protein